MKVLFLSAGTKPDYLCDMILHGLRSLLGADVVDVNRPAFMYDDFPQELKPKLWGRGFTVYGLLDSKLAVDRTDIERRIRAQDFEWVIFGSVHRCLTHLPLVVECYPSHRIVFLDGEDIVHIVEPLTKAGRYFKRELIEFRPDVAPISFSIPREKICRKAVVKTRLIAETPTNRHVFKDEQEYYRSYQTAYFGITHKKWGWDCCRHYEIMMNRCIPLFTDIHLIPPSTMTFFPKELVRKAIQSMAFEEYSAYQEKIFLHLCRHNTTEAMATYVLDTAEAHP